MPRPPKEGCDQMARACCHGQALHGNIAALPPSLRTAGFGGAIPSGREHARGTRSTYSHAFAMNTTQDAACEDTHSHANGSMLRGAQPDARFVLNQQYLSAHCAAQTMHPSDTSSTWNQTRGHPHAEREWEGNYSPREHVYKRQRGGDTGIQSQKFGEEYCDERAAKVSSGLPIDALSSEDRDFLNSDVWQLWESELMRE
jgi:hypothetical protein